MYFLELRVVLIVGFVVLLLVAILAVWLDRRLLRKNQVTGTQSARIDPSQDLNPLLNDLAHELRTPLAVLLTHLQAQRSPNIPTETRQESLRLMQAETRRMSRMVSNILELGELDVRGLTVHRPVDVRALASDVVREMMPLARERGIAVELYAKDGAYLISGDETRLKQVFLNLLDNALKYSRAGDRVDIRLEPDADTEQVLCAVCDTGPGIPLEHLPHLTRRFYRAASDEIEGSGLGLALVAKILQLHGSKLEIDSNSGKENSGTCVNFGLELVSPEEVIE